MGKLYVIGVDQMVLELTKQFMREGSVPTLAKLFEKSTTAKALASFPCWTPTNWSVISTGAHTGTHGAFAWFVHMPDGEDVSSLTSVGINAETIWEAAERQGLKCGVVHYPGSMPSRLEKGYVVDGNGGPAYGSCPYDLAAAEAYTTRRNVETAMLKEIVLKPAEGWKGLPEGGLQPLCCTIPVTTKKEELCQSWQLLVQGDAEGYDRVVVCRERDLSTALCETKLMEWSQWATVPFGSRRGTVRFKLTELSPDGKSIKLYRSQIMPLDGFSEPDEIGKELVEAIGPYQEWVSQMFAHLGMVDYQTCVEEADYQGQWLVKAALYLTQQKGCDIFFSHWHFLDDVNHFHLARLDPTWHRYNPDEAPKHWEIVRQAYRAIDHMMETLLAGINEDDHVVMVSDHGCSAIDRTVFMEKFLFDKGFLALKDPNAWKTSFVPNWFDKVDWERTKVWVHEGAFFDPFNIYINAKSPEEHKQIQKDLIRELRTWVDEETDRTPMAMVLSKQDAALIGLWGDQVGDVVAILDTGYSFGRKDSPTPIQWNKGQIVSGHGRMIPTSETAYGTEKAIFTIAGPGIKRGYEWADDKVGPFRLLDVTPTLCHLLGIQPPAQSQGSIAYDLFEGHEAVKERPNPTPIYEPTRHMKTWMQENLYKYGLLKEDSIPC